MHRYLFTRDTLPREGKRAFKAGEVVELSAASARHWLNRQAIVLYVADDPKLSAAEQSNVEEPIDETQNDDHLGDGSQPVDEAGGDGAGGARGQSGRGRRRK